MSDKAGERVADARAGRGAELADTNWITRLSADEIAFNLNDCDPNLLFADEEYQQLISGLKDRLPSIQSYFNLKADAGGFAAFRSLPQDGKGFEAPDLFSDGVRG